MAKHVKKPVPADATPEQRELIALSNIPRGDRTEKQHERFRIIMQGIRRERFVRYAGKRLEAAKKALDRVARLGNRNSFYCTDEEGQWTVQELTAAVKAVERAFAPKGGAQRSAAVYPWTQPPVNGQ